MQNKALISKTITIRDVAAEAGVSVALVSFVMNARRGPNGEYLCSASQETAERIVDVARRLGYHSNKSASSLRSGHNYTIGVIVPDISNSFFSEICRRIENLSSDVDYQTIVGSSDDNMYKFGKLVERFMHFGVDGIIAAPCPGTEPWISKLMERGIPVVLFDRDLPDLEGPGRVCLDNNLAGRLCARYLIKQGFRKINFVLYETDIRTVPERKEGFVEEMKEHGLEDDMVVTIVSKETMTQDLVSVVRRAKAEGCDALVFPSNTLTISGVSALNSLSYRVPEDFAVIGFDQGQYEGIYNSRMFFIDQSLALIAEYSFKMLLSAISGTPDMKRIILEPLTRNM